MTQPVLTAADERRQRRADNARAYQGTAFSRRWLAAIHEEEERAAKAQAIAISIARRESAR